MREVTDKTFSARLECHYLVQAPDTVGAKTPLVVALHGFGANPEAMLPLTSRLFEHRAIVVSLQGPYPFFLRAGSGDVGYGWITSRRPAESIRLHHEMVLHAADEAGREFGVSPERRLLVGFSQAVGLNYRLAATHPDAVRGVIGICGGLPGDWDDAVYPSVSAAVLHIARSSDEFYPPDVTSHYLERLRGRAADVEVHLIEGGHQMPSGGSRIVHPWLQRIFP